MLQPGDIVGRHRVELVLGEGGAATVYRVRHTVLGTLHALKVLHVIHPALRERLVAEGRIQARLRHPNILAVHDVLTVSGAPALLMDFVPGGTLAARIGRGVLPRKQALARFVEVVQGVAHAHADGVLHRDLHPGNVLLDDSSGAEIARVADFGIARVLGEAGARRTRTGVGMGTPAYMAPEQASSARDVDARADIFSLGVMLYELTTGQLPFDDTDSVAALLAAREGRWRRPAAIGAELPARVAQAIEGCLIPDPSDRLADCGALLAILEGREDARPPAAEETASSLLPRTTAVVPERLPSPPAPAPEDLPARAPSSAHSARAAALVVDPTGRGHQVELQVILEPGKGRAWAPEGIERDARVAAQLAMAAALGAEAQRWDLRWSVTPVGTRLHGTSLGLAIGVATDAARRRRSVPAGWAFTGGVELDGSVTAVSGVPAKIRAAAAAGAETVAVPASSTPGPAAPPGGPAVVHVSTLPAVLGRLHPGTHEARPRRWARLVVLGLPVLLALTSVLAPVEAWLSHGAVSLTRGPLPMDDVAVLAVDVPDPKALRAAHPATLRALADAGARAVVFDLAFSASTPEDAEIRDAIAELHARGVPVVLPARFRLGGVSMPTEVILDSPATVGIVEARRDTLLSVVRALPVRRARADGETMWNASVLAAAALQRPDAPPAPRVESDVLIVGSLRSPVWAGLLHLPPLGMPPVVTYGDTDAYETFRDRTVFIGAHGGSDDIHLTPGGQRYGVELLGGGLQTLLRQAALRRTAPVLDAGLALLTGLGTAWLAGALSVRRRRLALLVPAGAAAIGLALSLSGLIVGVLPLLLAAAIGSWAERHVRSGDRTSPETHRGTHP